jgi:ABC-2 type transport system permease protein
MLHLLKTEWLKIKKYPAFWLVMGVTALSYPGIVFMFYKMYSDLMKRQDTAGQLANAFLGNPFSMPEIWRTSAFASSVFVFIPAIVIIMLITNEYTYKTSRQNIIDGWSRNNFMTGKVGDVLIITGIITLLYILMALLIGLNNTSDPAAQKWKLSYYIGLFALQTFSQLSLAFLIGFLVRKAFLALGIFVFYFIIVEPIAVQFLKLRIAKTSIFYDAGRFLPIEISDRIIPPPAFIGRFDEKAYKASLDAVGIHVVYTILLTLLIWFICFRINQKRDL